MYKSIKNIFLNIIFLCVFLLPLISQAAYDVKGDTSKSINNVNTGSWFGVKTERVNGGVTSVETTTYTDNPNEKGVTKGDLYNSNESETSLDSARYNGLKAKLEAGGSSVKTNNLSINDLYVMNTKTGSVFVKKGDNGKDVIVAVATNDGALYIPKNPVPKEGNVAVDSLDPSTGNGLLNLIDQNRGLPVGTTVGAKNDFYQKQAADKLAQEKLTEANTDLQAANQALADFKASREYTSGNYDPAKLAQLQQNLAAAQAAQAAAQANANTAALNLAQAQQARDATAKTPEQCVSSVSRPFAPFDSLYCVLTKVAEFTNIIFKLSSFITYITGVLFDYSLEVSINSAEFFKQLGVIEVTWTFIRDILNITFIFILLWAAIQILLGHDQQYNAKKVLLNVVIVAILINFSLFAAKLMVDGSNIVSLKIYETMKVSSPDPTKKATISERVMNTVGLTALYDITKIFDNNSLSASTGSMCANNPGALITVSVLGSIFLIILSMALGLAAVLFIIRLVNIIFLFIKSPLWVWGWVLPNNPSITKFRDSWWNDMKHVLTFPIMYLFWMLVAVIIFTKLGQGSQGTSFLDLICSGPGSIAGSTSISVVFVFVIVIIFMMRAIQYGIKHAAGTEGTVGGKWSQSVANKFGGWQDAMTKGLAKKTYDKSAALAVGAGSLAAGAGIGTAKFTGRLTTGLAGGVLGKKGFKEGFSEGFLNPGINTKESMRDFARTIAANNPNNWLGSKAAKFADKYKDPTNAAGETRKQAEDRRVKQAKDEAKLVREAIEAHYKVESQKDWMKKKENDGKTKEDYKDYVEKQMANRLDAVAGTQIHNVDAVHSGETSARSHLDYLRDKAIEEVKDDSGNVTGYKLNEAKMQQITKEVIKYHTDEKNINNGAVDIKKKGQQRWEVLAKRRASARIKVAEEMTGTLESAALTKDADKERGEREIEKIRKAIEYTEQLPDEKTIGKSVTGITKYVGHGDNEKTIKELNTHIQNLADAVAHGATQPVLDTLQENVNRAQKKYIEHYDKQKDSLIKQKNNLANRIKKQAEADKDKK